MTEVTQDSFYSLSSEHHLRRVRPIEISLDRFESFLKKAEKAMGLT